MDLCRRHPQRLGDSPHAADDVLDAFCAAQGVRFPESSDGSERLAA